MRRKLALRVEKNVAFPMVDVISEGDYLWKLMVKTLNRGWRLDPSKFLSIQDVKKLRSESLRRKELAERNHRKILVRDWIVLEIGLGTGLRVQEIADLKCGDVYLLEERPFLEVQNGKCGKQRIVRFSKDLKASIENFLRWKEVVGEPTGNGAPLIRSSHTGGHLSTRSLQRIFEKWKHLSKIRLDHTFHHLRHTFGSHFYKSSGFNLRATQLQLGHSSIQTTQIYADALDPDMDQGVEGLYK